jgi:hypothetical protein
MPEYDARRKKRLQTVELLVAERDWEPPRPRFADDQIVALRVVGADVAVRTKGKPAGGTWNPERRLWQLRYDRVGALSLTGRIVDEAASNGGCPGLSGKHLHADARVPSRERCSHTLLDADILWQMAALQSNGS